MSSAGGSDVPSNSRTAAAELDALFRTDEGAPGANGYVDPSGQQHPQRGDDEAPWIKVPPFATQPQLWVRDMAVPLAPDADYAATPALDCVQQRLLQIYFDLSISDEDEEIAQLSIIPEGSAGGDFYVVGVVDLTVTVLTPANSARFAATNFGSRTFYQSELRTPQLAGPGHARFILAYDVSPFESFRLNVRDLVGSGGNTLTLRNAFSQ